MSTRGLYTFTDSEGASFTVFKHWDNYPSGAYRFIQNGLFKSWDLPRFEADEFAASFIAANKKAGGGDLRLTNEGTTNADALGIEFIYTITSEGGALKVITRDIWQGVDLPAVYITATDIILPITADEVTA
jgi:hypothetical protein